MKTNIIGFMLFLSVFLFYSCGGKTVKENETFGKIPSLVANYVKNDSIHKTQAEQDAKKLKVGDLKNYFEKFKKEEEEAEAKLKSEAKLEIAKLKDKAVPFSVENENFEIKNLKISDEEISNGKTVKLPFTFTVKKPITLPNFSNGYSLKYKLIDKDGNVIEKDKELTLILAENYNTKVVEPGKEVTQNIYLSLKNPAMANFKEIIFY